MVQSANARAHRPLAAASPVPSVTAASSTQRLRRPAALTGVIVTLALLLVALLPGSALAAKVLALTVGEVRSDAVCSVTVPVTNPNKSRQAAEVGVVEETTSIATYTKVTLSAGEEKKVVVTVAASGTYKGFAANGAGRTYSANTISVACE